MKTLPYPFNEFEFDSENGYLHHPDGYLTSRFRFDNDSGKWTPLEWAAWNERADQIIELINKL